MRVVAGRRAQSLPVYSGFDARAGAFLRRVRFLARGRSDRGDPSVKRASGKTLATQQIYREPREPHFAFARLV